MSGGLTLLDLLGDAQANSNGILNKLDAETMLEFVEQYPESLKGAAEGWARDRARSNPSEVFEVIEHLPEGKARSGAVQKMVANWACTEPLKAAAWVATRPDTVESQYAVRNLINAWGRQMRLRRRLGSQSSLLLKGETLAGRSWPISRRVLIRWRRWP